MAKRVSKRLRNNGYQLARLVNEGVKALPIVERHPIGPVRPEMLGVSARLALRGGVIAL